MIEQERRAAPISLPEVSAGAGERTAVESSDSGNHGRGDPNLALYFNDLAAHPVLKPEQEASVARRIQELEVIEWATLLSHACVVPHLLDQLRVTLNGQTPAEAREVLRHARFARRTGSVRLPAARRAAHQTAAFELGRRLRDLDCDRVLLNASTEFVRALPQMNGTTPRDLRRVVHAPRYARYLEAIAQAGRETARLKERFTLANLRLVISVARRYQRGRMALIDMIQEGNIGLMKAVDRFDVRRGFRFSTYASWWIRHAINRALADKGRAIRIPVHMLDTHQRIQRAFAAYAARRGSEPTQEEIGAVIGLDGDKVQAVRAQSFEAPLSLDRPLGDDDGRRFVDVLTNDEASTPLDDVCRGDWGDEVARLLERLPPIEACILRWRFGLGDEDEMTLKEIGDRFRLSRERIRQLQEQALTRMRKQLRGPF